MGRVGGGRIDVWYDFNRVLFTLPHPIAEGKKDAVTHTDRPWHCLVSYVDDLTVGGRRNSKGIFVDPMNLPSFGDKKPPKEPEDCFPQQCYEK